MTRPTIIIEDFNIFLVTDRTTDENIGKDTEDLNEETT